VVAQKASGPEAAETAHEARGEAERLVDVGSQATSRDQTKQAQHGNGNVTHVRKFRIVTNDEPPQGALTWSTSYQKGKALQAWRRAVCAAHSEEPRCLKVAWVLSELFKSAKGYAYPPDFYLARETGLPTNKLQDALTRLERGGSIIRVHRLQGEQTYRRIFPSATLIPPTLGGRGTPQQPGGHKRKEQPRLTQTQIMEVTRATPRGERYFRLSRYETGAPFPTSILVAPSAVIFEERPAYAPGDKVTHSGRPGRVIATDTDGTVWVETDRERRYEGGQGFTQPFRVPVPVQDVTRDNRL